MELSPSALLTSEVDASEQLVRTLSWHVIHQQLAYLLDLPALACGAGGSRVDWLTALKGCTNSIGDIAFLCNSTIQLVKLVSILERLKCIHDNKHTPTTVQELLEMTNCLCHFRELHAEDKAMIRATLAPLTIASGAGGSGCSLSTFCRRLVNCIVFVVEQRLGEPTEYQEFRASIQQEQRIRGNLCHLTFPLLPSPTSPSSSSSSSGGVGGEGGEGGAPASPTAASLASLHLDDCENVSDGGVMECAGEGVEVVGSSNRSGGKNKKVEVEGKTLPLGERSNPPPASSSSIPSTHSPELIEWSDSDFYTTPSPSPRSANHPPGQPASPSRHSLRTRRNPWNDMEINNLQKGIAQFGPGHWKEIRRNFTFQPGRTNVDIKDKYRNMTSRKGRGKF